MPRGDRAIEIEDLQPSRRIEENNAATGGHRDDPIPERPNSRIAAGDVKRAAAKAVGVMGASKKLDPTLKISPARPPGASKRAGGDAAGVRVVRKSNAEIAEGSTVTARRSPAPRTAQGALEPPKTRQTEGAGGGRRRVPAPGNIVTVPKGQLIDPSRKADGRATSSSGHPKPPKKSARAGTATGASRSKGADAGTAE